MGDFYVDDAFFDHPKAISAGEDACSLYVRGLAWAHRHNTGRIPKDALDQLTRKPRPKLLADRLTAVAPGQAHPLWHDRGDFYEIHDWDTRNAKVVARRQHAKEAAEERWRRARPTLPLPMPAHPPGNALADVGADALAVQSECLTNQGTKDQGAAAADPMPTRNGAGVRPAAAAVPDRGKPEAGTKPQVSAVDEALRLLAERRLAAHRGPVDNPGGWLRRAVEGLRNDLADRISQSKPLQLPDAEALADWLEPAQISRGENGAGERRDYDLERPDCETCEGSGWLERDDGTVVRCAHPATVS